MEIYGFIYNIIYHKLILYKNMCKIITINIKEHEYQNYPTHLYTYYFPN